MHDAVTTEYTHSMVQETSGKVLALSLSSRLAHTLNERNERNKRVRTQG